MPFTLCLLATLVLAYLFPSIGSQEGPLFPHISTKFAVAIIFLIQGISIPGRQLLAGFSKTKIHAYCLASNFLIAPAIMVSILLVFSNWIPILLQAPFIYLAVVPTTISSAIVFTASSGGERSTALFSATLSNLVGIVATPLLCLALITFDRMAYPPIAPLFGKLALLILLPLVFGQAIRRLCSYNFDKHARLMKNTANALVLFTVFIAFCGSVQTGTWSQLGGSSTAILIGVVLLFLVIQSLIAWFGSRFVATDTPNRIAAFFCSSQKTLAAGAPMAAVIFSESSTQLIGLLILPLVAYHVLQLLLAGMLSPRLAKK